MRLNRLSSQHTPLQGARLVTWSAVLLIAFLAIQPLIGLPPRGHDAFIHYYRIPVVSEMWQNGMLFSRWAPDLVYGYGSPLFNFYPPLSAYLLTALYWLAGQNGPVAYSLSYAVALLLTAVSMFLLGRRMFGTWGGLLASAAYTWSPHLLLQTYSRGSLSNALAMAFAPLAAFALLRAAERPTGRRVAFAALSVALVLVSHTAAGLLFVCGLVLVIGASRLLYQARPYPVLAALLLGLALSAFCWLPGLAEIGATRYAESVESGGALFADHFVDALAWPEQTIVGLAKLQQPHSAGLTQLLLAASAVVLAPLQWRRRRGSVTARLALLAGLCGLVGLSLFLFTTPASAWLWEASASLRQVQFPWRLLDLPLLLLCLAAAWWPGAVKPRWRPWLLAAILILLYLNAVPYLYPARLDELPEQPTLADVSQAQKAHGILGLTAWGEYSSEAVEQWPAGPAAVGSDRGAPLSDKLILPPSAKLHGAGGGLLAASWNLTVPKATAVMLAVHDFPGWRAEIDGAGAPIDSDRQGRMRIALPAGQHELSLSWTRTPVRWVADTLSLLALAGIGWLSVRPGRLPARETGAGTVQHKGAVPWPALLVLAGLLALKVGVFDRSSTPLVVYPNGQGIPGIPRPEQGDFGVFRLIGYEMAEPDLLALYWYAPRQVDKDYVVRLSMADTQGAPVYEVDNVYPGDKPTTSWEAGMLVRDVYRLPLDEQPAPAAYRLSVAVHDPVSGEPLPVREGPPGATTVGVGTVKRGPQSEAMPAAAQAVDALFGGSIALTHAQATPSRQAGEPLVVALYWAPRAPVDVDYTVFVHLTDLNGELIAALDAPPAGGLYPTSFWEPGEVIADVREIDLDLPPGDYQIQVGLYELESGVRLPASGASAEAGDQVTAMRLVVR